MDIKNYKKYIEFISEGSKDYVTNDTPEEIIKNKLTIIKNMIVNMFDPGDTSKDVSMSFKDLGMKLESAELSRSTISHKNLTIKFSDDVYYYIILFRINLDQLPKNGEEITLDSIKKVYMKFKKYKIDGFELMGEISNMMNVEDITEDSIINIKIELDEKFDNDSDDLSIEYTE